MSDKICLLPFVLIGWKFPYHLASHYVDLSGHYHAISSVVWHETTELKGIW